MKGGFSRDDYSAADLREYDCFGPWALQIKSADEMPSQFRGDWETYKDASLILKFPREVDRRDARPGQELYRAILAVYDDRLGYRFSLDERSTSRQVEFTRITALRNHRDLLKGSLTLFQDDGQELAIDYNAVSWDLLEAVSERLRPAPVVRSASLEGPIVQVREYPFIAVLHKMKIGDAAAQPIYFSPARVNSGHLFRRAERFHGFLLIDNGRELIAVTRSQSSVKRRVHRSYALSLTYIPYSSIQGWTIDNSPLLARDILWLRIFTPGKEMLFPIGAASPGLEVLETRLRPFTREKIDA
jgi:hypothetical protein